MKLFIVVVILFICTLGNADMRIKRDGTGGDFLSNLGSQLGNMLNAFLGQKPNNPQPNQQPIQNGPVFQQPVQNPPLFQQRSQNPPIFQQQIDPPPQQVQAPLPTLGTNSAYDRRVAQMNSRRRLFHNSNVQPAQLGPPQSWPQGQGQEGRPIQVIDQNGQLSYCNSYPADCSYLACLADNFQHSENAANLKMAGKVFLDRKLRRAVANDPLISQAACDKVHLDANGCKGFRQILGLIDSIAPGPTSEETNRDPEELHGRNKREEIDIDFDQFDVEMSPKSKRDANGGWNFRPGQNNRNVAVPGDPNRNQGPSQQSTWNANANAHDNSGQRHSHTDYYTDSDQHGPGRSGTPNGPGPNPNPGNNGGGPPPTVVQPNGDNRGNRNHGLSPDYAAFYEHGGAAGHGNERGNGNAGNVDGGGIARYKPRDCKAIIRNNNERGK